MNEVIDSAGRSFCTFAGAMFIQSTVLVAVLFVADWLLRKRVKATFRYWLWMLVFIKLILPPGLSSPTSLGYWYHDWFPAAQSSPSVSVPVQEPVTVETQDFASLRNAARRRRKSHPQLLRELRLPSSIYVGMTWQGVLFLLWLVGVLVLSTLLIERMYFVRGLIAQSSPAVETQDFASLLDRCRRQIGVRQKIGLRLSPATFSPADLRPVSPRDPAAGGSSDEAVTR